MKTSPPLPRLATTAWAVTLALYASALVWTTVQRWVFGSAAYEFWLETTVSAAVYASIGALIVARRPGHKVGWLFTGLGLAGAIQFFTGQYATAGLARGADGLPGASVAAWLSVQAVKVSLYGFMALLLLFPSGRLPSRRWRPLAWSIVLGLLYEWAVVGLIREPLGPFPTIQNPFGIFDPGALAGRPIITILGMLLPFAFLASIASLFVRLWFSHGLERQQLRWFVLATPLGISLLFLPALLFPRIMSYIPGSIAWALAPLGPPIAATIAIVRYRLYDIDVIIRRTLIYALLTATLTSLYFGSVVVLQQLFRALTGEGNQIAIVISTLAIAALFSPIRRRIQILIDRRFYRRRYKMLQILETFSGTLRDEVDLSTLTNNLLITVEDTLQPAHVSLWLRTSGQKK